MSTDMENCDQAQSRIDGAYVLNNNIAEVTIMCNTSRQVCGAVMVPENAKDSAAVAPGIAWTVGTNSRPVPFSAIQGVFSRSMKHGPYGGRPLVLDAALCSFSAIIWHRHIKPPLKTYGVWKNSRNKQDGIQVCNPDTNFHCWLNPKTAPTKKRTWNTFFSRDKLVTDKGNSHFNCAYDTHPAHKRFKRSDLAVLSNDVHQRVGCKDCFRQNCLQTIPEIETQHTTRGELMSRPSFAKTIYANATPDFKKIIKPFLENYRLVHKIGSIDPRYFARTNDELERHGTAIVNAWLMFRHVYAKRPAALTITPFCPLTGLRRYWVSRTNQRHATKGLREDIDAFAETLHLWGQCSAIRFRTSREDTTNPVLRTRQPWVVYKPEMLKLHPKFEFINIENATFTRAYVHVWSAIVNEDLALHIDLTPPVKPGELLPPVPAHAVNCMYTHNISPCNAKEKESGVGTAHRKFPSVLVAGEYTTWEQLSNLLTLVTRAAYEAGMERAPQLKLSLVGSYSEAVNGPTQTFGDVVVPYGAAFVELTNVALQKFQVLKTLSVSRDKYCDTLEYCDHLEYKFIDAVMKGESMSLKKSTIDLCVKNCVHFYEQEGKGSRTAFIEWPAAKSWEDNNMFRIFVHIQFTNETPDELLGIDDETSTEIPLINFKL